ncbi:hypothetical protein A2U01_0052950, partial [Trifolium medium]|nr:hypothetical protein [Trifolium medium]
MPDFLMEEAQLAEVGAFATKQDILYAPEQHRQE